MSNNKKRVRFNLRQRIRDHDECFMYPKCLEVAAKLNAPRVCWEGCWLYRPPKPGKAREIGETLENIQVLIPIWLSEDDAKNFGSN